MHAAADATNLTAADMKPWHLRARYKQFRPDGTLNREGVFEEWWAAPMRWKTVNTNGDSTHTEYRTASGTVFTGDMAFAPGPFTEILLHPLPYPSLLDRLDFNMKEVSLGNLKLRCYSGTMKDRARTFQPTAYCFSNTYPVLRATIDSSGNRATWNDINKLCDRFVAKRIELIDPVQHPIMNVDVDLAESVLGIDEAALVPPADAKPLPPRKIAVSAGVMSQNKVSGNSPRYPQDALSAHVQGTVVIQTTISATGAVEQLHVISGPPLLQKASIDAVKNWRYQPYLLNGEPVEVETTVNVVFNISGGR